MFYLPTGMSEWTLVIGFVLGFATLLGVTTLTVAVWMRKQNEEKE